MFAKESLEHLKSRIDLVEALSPYVEFKKAGAAYKALCPFHDEKSPSFMIQRGDSHYHCFGCGAHGDAIAFLMNHQGLSFGESVELLAERFQVHLERTETVEEKGPSKKEMRFAMELACSLYHALLLHTEEGHEALRYLYRRGLTLDFVRTFEIGFAPKHPGLLRRYLKEHKIPLESAEVCGLLKGQHDFFSDRILFPIRGATGSVIGFSGRKFKEATFGGKYVNTPETPLFKKSKVLFGLNYSRHRIIKERRALIVEGQIDALKLIDQGFDFTVAAQGTAFGEGHVQELLGLGILTVYLAMDSDGAGLKAMEKVGALFHQQGIEAKIVSMPEGLDPDQFLREQGKEAFAQLLEEAEDYLTFLVKQRSRENDLTAPAQKNACATELSQAIRGWKGEVMVHESLKKLAQLLHVPESLVGVGQLDISPLFYKKSASAGLHNVDPDWVIETDLLRWLLLSNTEISQMVSMHLNVESFKIAECKQAFLQFAEKQSLDLLALCQIEEGNGQKLVMELTERKINRDKALDHFKASLQTLLDRNWLEKREAIRQKIQSGGYDDDEALMLAKEFEEIKRCKPKV